MVATPDILSRNGLLSSAMYMHTEAPSPQRKQEVSEPLLCLSRQEAEEHDRAMDALESALEDARSAARSKEQKLVIATKEMKARPLRIL